MKLNVYRSSVSIGALDMEGDEPFLGFTYDPRYLALGHASALSLSLPLRVQRFPGAQSLPYFEGLLPEGQARHTIARRLGISEHSPSKLLRALGRDCAGDVMVVEQDDPVQPPAEAEYAPLSGGVRFIGDNPAQEVSRLQEDYRLSLAGGQEKAALYHDPREPIDRGWYIPLAGSPSTHILKPEMSQRYPSLALNEFLCMRTAAEQGIPAAKTDLLFPDRPLLVVERYDREYAGRSGESGLPVMRRIHQEDFCQALGYASSKKYEGEGGPGAKDIRTLLALHSSSALEDIAGFVDVLMFNYLIGNCDAHAKNYSIMHRVPRADRCPAIRLAPAYDLVSTAIYAGGFGSALSRSMGMRIGGHLNIDRVSQDDMRVLAAGLKVSEQVLMAAGSRLASGLEGALNTAAHAAQDKGFGRAQELAERILQSAYGRKGLFA